MTPDRNRTLAIWSGILTALNIIGLLIFTVFMVFLRGQFLAMYNDFGVALPVLTQLVFSIPSWFVLLASVSLIIVLIAKEFIPNKAIPLIANIIWAVLAVAMSMLVGIALFAPHRAVVAPIAEASSAQETTQEEYLAQ